MVGHVTIQGTDNATGKKVVWSRCYWGVKWQAEPYSTHYHFLHFETCFYIYHLL